MLQQVQNDAACYFKITDCCKKLVLLSATFPLYIKHTWEAMLCLFSEFILSASENRWGLLPQWAALTGVKFHQKKGSVVCVESYSQLSRWIFCCRFVWIW